jgi:peptide/nickel transport system substrate-binding protein
LLVGLGVSQAQTLRIIPSAPTTVLDPFYTVLGPTRDHAYLIYDTLFGATSAGKVEPQMVQSWTVSPDKKQWIFTLRDGLEFHNTAPVTSEDVIASLKRWSQRDSFGTHLFKSVDTVTAVNSSTFSIALKEPYPLMLEALSKRGANVPFIMLKRIADTSAFEPIKEHIGSGPYKFLPEEFKPGDKLVYAKNERYKPRTEKPDGTTGGKNVYVDRIEVLQIKDPQTQYSALLAGEADILQSPVFEQLVSLKTKPDIVMHTFFNHGLVYGFRINHLHPPFNNAAVRKAAMIALGQEDMLKTQVASPGMYRFCQSIYPCTSAYTSNNTGIYTGKANPQLAKQMLFEAGYKGEVVVILRPNDANTFSKVPLVAKQQLELAGFKVEIASSDTSSWVARLQKKDLPSAGGYSAFIPAWLGIDLISPMTNPMLRATGEKGYNGWQDDPTLESFKDQFARADTDAQRKQIAEQIQLRAIETVSYVTLGEATAQAAVRKNITGMLPNAGVAVYWNIKKIETSR